MASLPDIPAATRCRTAEEEPNRLRRPNTGLARCKDSSLPEGQPGTSQQAAAGSTPDRACLPKRRPQ